MPEAFDSCFVTADDGLRLHYRLYCCGTDSLHAPVVCLAGLTRNSADFDPLATFLSQQSRTPRTVLAIDYRGRGRSDHDPDWQGYTLERERADLLPLLYDRGIERAHFIGTSRGGLHIMALAALHADLIVSAVFNDIGPVLEPAGLARIRGYVGKSVQPRSFAEARAILESGSARDFDGLSEAEWRQFVVSTFGPDETQLRSRYDPNVAHALDGLDLSKPLPESWPLFDKLRPRPVLTIRGANSDLLSAETFTMMSRRWPGCEAWQVTGQGHAPLLADAPTIRRIDAFLRAADDVAEPGRG